MRLRFAELSPITMAALLDGDLHLAGTVEIAYSVGPAHRRQGYATAILTALLQRAATEPGVTAVRASIRPTNTASLATIARHGFTKTGEQWDETDGLELIFERPARNTS